MCLVWKVWKKVVLEVPDYRDFGLSRLRQKFQNVNGWSASASTWEERLLMDIDCGRGERAGSGNWQAEHRRLGSIGRTEGVQTGSLRGGTIRLEAWSKSSGPNGNGRFAAA